MASATRKTVEKVVKEDVITLELTQEEAHFLRSLIDGYGENETHWGIRDALREPAETRDRPIQVGEAVRIVESAYDQTYNGRIGTLGDIDAADSIGTYRVNFTDGDWDWAETIERVND